MSERDFLLGLQLNHALDNFSGDIADVEIFPINQQITWEE